MKNEILTRMIEELETSNYVVPKGYKNYQYNDVLSVIKALKDNEIVKVTPNNIRLINRTNLPKKLEMVKNYYL
jgi:hypothetical protein